MAICSAEDYSEGPFLTHRGRLPLVCSWRQQLAASPSFHSPPPFPFSGLFSFIGGSSSPEPVSVHLPLFAHVARRARPETAHAPLSQTQWERPRPSPQLGRNWSRGCASRDEHGRLAALLRLAAPGWDTVPWQGPAPPQAPWLRPHMAASPGLPRPWPRPRSPGGAGRRRRREGQVGRERWGRAVAEGGTFSHRRRVGDGQKDEENRG